METIGTRIRTWRKRRGMSQQVLADFAGLSQPYLSQLELGHRSIERRSTLASLAEALQVSVAELTGSADTTDPSKQQAIGGVPAVREALVMREAGERDERPVPQGWLDRAMAASARGDVAALAPLLPTLLRGCDGPELVDVANIAMFQLKYLGYVDLAREVAKLAVTTARVLEDPVLLGVAGFAHVHAMPAETAGIAAKVAQRFADELQSHVSDPRVRQAYGMLHLSAALRSAAARQAEPARSHIAEARAEAGTLGEPDRLGVAMLAFGPTNVGIWDMTVAAELAEPDDVLRTAEQVTPQHLGIAHRQAVYHVERGRALVAVGRDDAAVLAFLQAEEVTPQWVRLQPTVCDAVTTIVNRTREATVSRPLRRLAAAFGVRP